jgi:PAS domain-containing protein
MAIGRLASEVLPGQEPLWIKTYGEVALTGQPTQFDSYTQALDKYYRVYAYRPALGQFAVIFMDITEIKQTELKLNAIAEKYATLFNTTSDGVCIHNLDGEILEVNDAYCSCLAIREQNLSTCTSVCLKPLRLLPRSQIYPEGTRSWWS